MWLQPCYICEELSREGKAKTGACMQCNRAGCKQHFHVTWSVSHVGDSNRFLQCLFAKPLSANDNGKVVVTKAVSET